MLATAYIDRYPADITGAILAEPGGFTWKDVSDYVSRTRAGKILSEDISDVLYFDQILTGKEDQHSILDYKFGLTIIHDNAKGNVTGNAGPTPSWRHGAVVHDRLFEIADKDGLDFTRNLGQFTTKVLFLYSELNTAYGPSHAQQVSSAYPNVQMSKIKGTGHEIPWFGWENFFPTALEYLNVNN